MVRVTGHTIKMANRVVIRCAPFHLLRVKASYGFNMPQSILLDSTSPMTHAARSLVIIHLYQTGVCANAP